MDLSSQTAAVVLAYLLARFVKGVIGLGLPTVAIGMLVLVMSPAQAAAVLIVPSLVTNIWQMLSGLHLLGLLRWLWPMLAAICAGIWAGAGLMATDAHSFGVTALGATLAVYLIGLTLRPLVLPPGWEP